MLSIKKATLNDCLLINKLASQTWENTYKDILSHEQLAYMFDMMYAPENLLRQMTEQQHRYFIVSSDDVPCGYISIEQQAANLFNFQKIYLLPSFHGQGVGRYLINQGIAYVKSIHPTPCKIELYVNRHNKAVDFYKHMGFKIVATRDHAIGNGYYMNDYIMEKNI